MNIRNRIEQLEQMLHGGTPESDRVAAKPPFDWEGYRRCLSEHEAEFGPLPLPIEAARMVGWKG